MSTKRLFKRVMTGVLTASIAFSSAALMAFQSSAAVTYQVYQANYKDTTMVSSQEISTASSKSIIAWVNGGKAKYEIASTGIVVEVDGKTASLRLRANDGSENFDISSSKSVVWAVVESDGAAIATGVDSAGVPTGGFSTTGKLKTALGSGADEIFKVAAGKVTAGKKAGTGTIGIYLPIKSGSTTTNYLLASFPVEIKMAPGNISTFTDSSGIVWTGTTKTKPANTFTVGLDVATESIYVVPKDSATSTDSAGIDPTSTYTVSVDTKSAKFVDVSVAGTNSWSDKVEIKAGDLYAFQVKGTALDSKTTNGVTTYSNPKASVTITNNQSGKTAKVSVTVVNTALQAYGDKATADGVFVYQKPYNVTTYKVSKATDVAFDIDVAAYKPINSDGTTANSDGVVMFNSDGLPVTIKPTIGVFKEIPTMDKLVKDGKIKFDYGAAASSIKGETAISAKTGDKTNKLFTVKPKAADYLEAKSEYLVIAYGTARDQIVVLPIVLQSPLVETTIEIPVKGLDSDGTTFAVDSAGVKIALSADATKKAEVTSVTTSKTAAQTTGTLTIKANMLPGTKYKVSLEKAGTTAYTATAIEVTTGKVKSTPAAATDDWGKAKLPSSITSSKQWVLAK